MEWLPIINLFFAPVGTVDLIYKVLQVLAALKILAEAGQWIAARTEWRKDDEFFARLLYRLGKATSFIRDLASANTRPK